MKFVLAVSIAIALAAPAFAANEKPEVNAGKTKGQGKGWHCGKLAREKHQVQDGRALNRAVGAAIQRCREHGPSAI